MSEIGSQLLRHRVQNSDVSTKQMSNYPRRKHSRRQVR